MPTKLNRWGNSIGIRIPRHVAEIANLKAGDFVYVRVLDGGDIQVRAVKPRLVDEGYEVNGNRSGNPVPKTPVEEW